MDIFDTAYGSDMPDMDIDACTLVSYARFNAEFIIQLEGGFGTWIDSTTHEEARVGRSKASIAFGYVHPQGEEYTEALANNIDVILSRWQSEETLLRLVCAPGKFTVLIEDENKFLPIPRA